MQRQYPPYSKWLGSAFARTPGGAGLGLTEPLDPGTRPYFDRPYQVLGAGRFAAALTGAITDPLVRRLGPAGVADQVLDSTQALGDLRYAGAVASVSGI
jgi:hypothetical protein